LDALDAAQAGGLGILERRRAGLLLRVRRLTVDLAVEDATREADRIRRAERAGPGQGPDRDPVVEIAVEIESRQEVGRAAVAVVVRPALRRGRRLDRVGNALGERDAVDMD